MKLYFDGCKGTDAVGHEWMTLAGIAGSKSAWSAFVNAWEAMLKNREPKAEYVHMTDIVTGNGRFKSSAGWTLPTLQRLVSDAIVDLNGFPGQFVAFYCTIDLTAHQTITSEG